MVTLPSKEINRAAKLMAFANKTRQKHGLVPLERSTPLDSVALQIVREIYRRCIHQDRLDTEDWRENDRANEAGYSTLPVAVNLACNLWEPEAVIRDWKKNPANLENILNADFVVAGAASWEGRFAMIFGTERK